MQLIVRKDMKLEWPRIETPTHWIMIGLRRGPEQGDGQIAVRETVDFLAAQKMVPLSRYEAYSLTSMVGDCRVSQVVDVRKGVHCMVPKCDLRQEVAVRRARSPARSRSCWPPPPRGAGGPLPSSPPPPISRRSSRRWAAIARARREPRARRSTIRTPSRSSPAQLARSRGRRAAGAHRPRPRAVAARARCARWATPGSGAGRRRATSTSRAASPCCRPRRRAARRPSAARTCTASATRTTGSIPRTRGRSPRRILAALARLAPGRRARCSRRTAPLPRAARRGPGALARGAGAATRARAWSSTHDSWPYFARALRPHGGRRRSSRRRACRPRRPASARSPSGCARRGVRLIVAEPSAERVARAPGRRRERRRAR